MTEDKMPDDKPITTDIHLAALDRLRAERDAALAEVERLKTRMHYLTGDEATGWLHIVTYSYLRQVKRHWGNNPANRIGCDEATEIAEALCERFAAKERTYDAAEGMQPPGAPEPCRRCEPFIRVIMLERDHAQKVEVPDALARMDAAEAIVRDLAAIRPMSEMAALPLAATKGGT